MKESAQITVLNYPLSEYIRRKEENETLRQIIANQMCIMRMLLEKEGVDTERLEQRSNEMALERIKFEEENNITS